MHRYYVYLSMVICICSAILFSISDAYCWCVGPHTWQNTDEGGYYYFVQDLGCLSDDWIDEMEIAGLMWASPSTNANYYGHVNKIRCSPYDSINPAMNGFNSVTWEEVSENTTDLTLGYARTWTRGNEIGESDIVLYWNDSNRRWTADCQLAQTDPNFHYFRDVVVHEYGHTIGVDHEDCADSCVPISQHNSVMACYQAQCWSQITSDDLTAVRTLYGPCDCTSGPCCDGCHFLPSNFICEEDVSTEYYCRDGTGCGQDVFVHHEDRYCSGTSGLCTGALQWDQEALHDNCNETETCSPGESSCAFTPACDCECTSGPCCDGCHFRASSFMCDDDASTEYTCRDGTDCGDDVFVRQADRYCSGTSNLCTGALQWGQEVVHVNCDIETERCSPGESSCAFTPACTRTVSPIPPVPGQDSTEEACGCMTTREEESYISILPATTIYMIPFLFLFFQKRRYKRYTAMRI